ncbi:MAG: hypothetical protein ACK4WM_11065, partial [Thermoflexales bacterium]
MPRVLTVWVAFTLFGYPQQVGTGTLFGCFTDLGLLMFIAYSTTTDTWPETASACSMFGNPDKPRGLR